MPEHVVAEALGGIVRFVGRILVEFFLEFIIRGTGYALLRAVRSEVKPDDTSCLVVGLVFWAVVAVGGFFAWRVVAA
ncbi:hypothetical protein [Pseudoxanthomonas suwonensis]|uniref:hypothetical protein n=1 Tax=Pseudoxanthomonas suwonensis TaxID=314722 RepID=UPI0004640D4F|nr:hypothetical protein [Pseudoxanthomonas suwonensis]